MKKHMLHKIIKCWPLALALLLLGLTALADVSLPADLVVIEDEAFRGNTGLTGTLHLPEDVAVIGARAFEGCTGLTGQLVIPSTVITIGSRAFADCTGLTGTVRIPPSVTSLAEDAFAGTSLIISTGGSSGGGLPIVTKTDLPEGVPAK